LYDLNDSKLIYETKIMDKSICEMTQVSQHQWIISGHDNKLVLMDSRFFDRQVISFKHHVNSCSKFTPSFDTDLRVVSSPGDDCITRVWSMDSGKLVNEISLPIDITPVPFKFVYSWFLLRPNKLSPCVISLYGSDLILYD